MPADRTPHVHTTALFAFADAHLNDLSLSRFGILPSSVDPYEFIATLRRLTTAAVGELRTAGAERELLTRLATLAAHACWLDPMRHQELAEMVQSWPALRIEVVAEVEWLRGPASCSAAAESNGPPSGVVAPSASGIDTRRAVSDVVLDEVMAAFTDGSELDVLGVKQRMRATGTERSRNHITRAMSRLAVEGRLVRVRRGTYRMVTASPLASSCGPQEHYHRRNG